MDDLLELLGNVMQYIMIEDRSSFMRTSVHSDFITEHKFSQHKRCLNIPINVSVRSTFCMCRIEIQTCHPLTHGHGHEHHPTGTATTMDIGHPPKPQSKP